LKAFGRCNVVVGGTSMWPFIKQGDIVTVCQKPFIPALGMVVAFFIENQFVVRRVVWYRKIEENRWQLIIRGDTCPGSLTRIDSDQVIGTVSGIKRGDTGMSCWCEFPWRIVTILLGFMLQLAVAIKSSLSKGRTLKIRDVLF